MTKTRLTSGGNRPDANTKDKEVRDRCADIQYKLMLTDSEWENLLDNKQGLYGWVSQLIQLHISQEAHPSTSRGYLLGYEAGKREATAKDERKPLDFKKYFEANLLDGDAVQDGQMMAATEVYEIVGDYIAQLEQRVLEAVGSDQPVKEIEGRSMMFEEGNKS